MDRREIALGTGVFDGGKAGKHGARFIADIWGMEFEGAAILFRGLEATVSYRFLAPKYTKWLDQGCDANGAPILDPAGNPVLENVADKRRT